MNDYKQKTDEELAKTLKTDPSDQQAWTEIFERLQPLIYHIISMQVWGFAVAEYEVIAQEIQIEFIKSIKGFRGRNADGKPCLLKTYLYRVAHRKCIKIAKNGRRQRELEQYLAESQQGSGDLSPTTSGAQNQAEMNEFEKEFMEAWNELSEDMQLFIRLKYIDGFSYKDIENDFGISPDRKKVKRALDAIKKRLQRRKIHPREARFGIRKLMEVKDRE